MRASVVNPKALAGDIKGWAKELGFQQAGIADPDLGADEIRLLAWLDAGRHGEMHYMERHGLKRSRPALLHPGTLRVISVRMDYLPRGAAPISAVLQEPTLAFISRYALGRDYHKLMRKRLQKLAEPGSVLVSDATEHLIASYFEFEDLGAVGVKGKAEPVHVYEVVSARSVTGRIEAAGAEVT